MLLTLNLNYNNIANRGFVALSKAFRWGAVGFLYDDKYSIFSSN
jgi:hypothetical protein